MAVEEREGIPPDQQRIISKGEILEDSKTLQYYGVNDGATLHLVLRLRGGGYRAVLDFSMVDANRAS